MRLTVNIATRNRPELLRRTIGETLKNIKLPTTQLMVSCDEDDEESIRAARQFWIEVPVSVEPREDSIGAKWNRAMTYWQADAYLPMVDYAPVMTPGFDEIICEALSKFPDGYGYVAGPLANLSFPSLQAITHKFAIAMGGIYPTYWPFWFVDHWLQDIALMTGRARYVPIEVDCHRTKQKTMELRDLRLWADLYDALVHERCRIALDILNAEDFEIPAWMGEMLVSMWPQIAQRSCIINNICRENAAALEHWNGSSMPDGRYLRIKAKGEALLEAAMKSSVLGLARAVANG